jgi:hypothetical protein
VPLERRARHLCVAALQVDLGAVASREHDPTELPADLDRVPIREVEPFPQLQGRMPVRNPDGEEALCCT